MKIHLGHLDELRICHKGGRRMAAMLKLSWDDFVENGIEILAIENIDDANIQRVIRYVRKRDGQHQE